MSRPDVLSIVSPFSPFHLVAPRPDGAEEPGLLREPVSAAHRLAPDSRVVGWYPSVSQQLREDNMRRSLVLHLLFTVMLSLGALLPLAPPAPSPLHSVAPRRCTCDRIDIRVKP